MQGAKLLPIGVLVLSCVAACADTRGAHDVSNSVGGSGGAAAGMGGAAGGSGEGMTSGGSGDEPDMMVNGSGGRAGIDAGGDSGLPIDDEPIELPRCGISAGDHAMASCGAGPCPVVSDVVLGCDDWEFAAPGLRVAITPDGASLFTSSSDRALELTARDNEGEMLELPTVFNRNVLVVSQMQDGEVVLASSALWSTDGAPITNNPVIVRRERDTWVHDGAPLMAL